MPSDALPPWYVWTVNILVAIVGLLGVIGLSLTASAWLIDKITRAVGLHRCFVDFMFDWVRRRKEREEAKESR